MPHYWSQTGCEVVCDTRTFCTDLPIIFRLAQAEGAIEGVYTDYIVPHPFSTNFKYARFDAGGPISPRDAASLTGSKSAAVSGSQAGSVELHGVEEQATQDAGGVFVTTRGVR